MRVHFEPLLTVPERWERLQRTLLRVCALPPSRQSKALRFAMARIRRGQRKRPRRRWRKALARLVRRLGGTA